MPEILFVSLVVAGQVGVLVSLFNRVLMNKAASWRRAVVMSVSPIVLVAGPLVVLVVVHQYGILSDIARFRGPRAAVWLTAAYVATVLVAVARFLWVSLITLPRRKRSDAVAAESRPVCSYRPDDGKAKGKRGSSAFWPIARLLTRRKRLRSERNNPLSREELGKKGLI